MQRRDQARGGGRSERHGIGGEQIEGRRAVLELLRANRRPVRQVIVSDGIEPSQQIDEIEMLAKKGRVPLSVVSRGRFERLARTQAPQGVLALAREIDEVDIADLCEPVTGIVPFIVVFDGVTDPQNLGSLLRSAECAGVNGIVLARHRAVSVTPAVAKVAAGAIERLRIASVPGVPSALSRMSELGVVSVGLEPSAPTSIFEIGAELQGPVALVLGSEGRGLASLTRKRCSMLASIPQLGTLASLNVASAGAVACFEVARRRTIEV